MATSKSRRRRPRPTRDRTVAKLGPIKIKVSPPKFQGPKLKIGF